MDTHQLLQFFEGVRRIGNGRWIVKCPAHKDKTPSLSIRKTDDGKYLLKCWAGCDTENVLAAAGLKWSNLFPESSPSWSPQSRPDPQKARRLERERQLREWADITGRAIRDRLYQRHRLITEGENLITEGNKGRGWDLLALGYLGLSRLEWVLDLLDSREAVDWLQAQEFLKRN